MSSRNLLRKLGLQGLIHISGEAGTGKTLFACLVASDASRLGKVEWINTDAKQSFITLLKRTVETRRGRIQNITVTMESNRNAIRNIILNLAKDLGDDVSLLVIDSLTRVLDMSRQDPILWGREMIEEVLPTLAGIANERGVDILITSESRTLDHSRTLAVHHKSIAKWADCDIHLVKDGFRDMSHLKQNEHVIGSLQLDHEIIEAAGRAYGQARV